MADENGKLTIRRTGIYILGILLVSLGIVLCKKCGMGISPISSIPFVLVDVTSITFGNLTTLFHFINIALQMILMKTFRDPRLWLQVPLAFVFGWVIDWMNQMIVIDDTVLMWQIIALVLSIFFTALGMVCMLEMNLIQNPPDGAVRQISSLLNKELGTVKIAYDVSCVVISALFGLIFLHRIKGFGIATIASAIFVGRTISWIKGAVARQNQQTELKK